MAIWRQVRYGIRRLFCVEQCQRDLEDEFEQYLCDSTAAFRDAGATAGEALIAAMEAFGAPEEVAKEVEQQGWESHIQPHLERLRTAMRHILQRRRMAWVTLLCLSLAMGLNAAAVHLMTVLLVGHVVALDGANVVRIGTAWPTTGNTTDRTTGADIRDARSSIRALSYLSVFQSGSTGVKVQSKAAYLIVTKVDKAFSKVFALRPSEGRILLQSDANKAALVSDAFARNYYAFSANAVGKTIEVEGNKLEIVGVMPPRFSFPNASDVWIAASDLSDSPSRTSFNYQAVARLRPGTQMEDLQHQLDNLSRRLQIEHPNESEGRTLIANELRVESTKGCRAVVILSLCATALLLLLASLNTLGFHLTLVSDWRRWITRGDIADATAKYVGQVAFHEVFILMCLSASVALLIGVVAQRIGLSLLHATIAPTLRLDNQPGLPTLCLVLIPAFTTLLLIGQLSVRSFLVTNQGFCARHRGTRLPRSRSFVWQGLAAAGGLLLSAGCLMYWHIEVLRHEQPGFAKQSLDVFHTGLPDYRASSSAIIETKASQVLDSFARQPNVESAAGVMGLPFDEYGSNGSYEAQRPNNGISRYPHATFAVISPAYFRTMRIPFIVGRDFNADDKSANEPVAIVSESLARKSFGTINALGQRIRCGLDTGLWMRIIGIVGDTKQSTLSKPAGSTIYMPLGQHVAYAGQMSVVVRTKLTPANLEQAVAPFVHQIDPAIPISATKMADLIDRSLAAERFESRLLIGLGLISGLLAGLALIGQRVGNLAIVSGATVVSRRVWHSPTLQRLALFRSP